MIVIIPSSTIFIQLAAYHQTKRLRIALFRTILRQDIGWHDANRTGEFSTKLSE